MNMRNKDLPKLLRALASGTDAKNKKLDIVFEQAATELEKLDMIEIIVNSIAASKESILNIINDNRR